MVEFSILNSVAAQGIDNLLKNLFNIISVYINTLSSETAISQMPYFHNQNVSLKKLLQDEDQVKVLGSTGINFHSKTISEDFAATNFGT